jgi:hypothetical protein
MITLCRLTGSLTQHMSRLRWHTGIRMPMVLERHMTQTWLVKSWTRVWHSRDVLLSACARLVETGRDPRRICLSDGPCLVQGTLDRGRWTCVLYCNARIASTKLKVRLAMLSCNGDMDTSLQ